MEEERFQALQLKKEAQEREFEALRCLMEEATDQEIEDMRAGCVPEAPTQPQKAI